MAPHLAAEPGDPDEPLRARRVHSRQPHPRERVLPTPGRPGLPERVCVDTPKNVRKAKKAIKKAFQNQIDGGLLVHRGGLHLSPPTGA